MIANSDEKKAEKHPVKEQLKKEIAQWQTKMDEAKLQLHLGAKEVQDEIQPHVEILAQELIQAKKQLQAFENAAEDAWQDINEGIKASFHVMQTSFENAQKHFK